MQVNVAKQEGNKVELQIEVGKDKVNDALNKAYQKVVRQVRMPGFRPGKIPRKVLEKHFGKEVLKKEALDTLISETYLKAIDESKQEVIAPLEFKDIGEIEQDRALKFTALVEVKPEVELGEYKEIEIVRKKRLILEEDIDKSLKSLQEESAKLIPVEDRPAKEGDLVFIDFEGKAEGKPFEGGKGRRVGLELGKRRSLPGFEEKLVGTRKEEEKEIRVNLPENFPEELKGKEALFKVKLLEIKEKEFPPIDDELAKELKFNSLEELKVDLRKRLEAEALFEEKRDLEEQVVEKILEGAKLDLPKTMVEREIKRRKEGVAGSLQMKEGDLEKELREGAERKVKVDLVLDTIAKAEKIEVTSEEEDEEIKKIAKSLKQEAGKVREFLEKSGQINNLKEEVRRAKTITYLTEQAKVSEKGDK